METAIMWGWILTAQMTGMPPIIDPNFKTEMECEAVKTEFVSLHPAYQDGTFCTPTWKPDKPVRKKRIAKKPTPHKRYVRR